MSKKRTLQFIVLGLALAVVSVALIIIQSKKIISPINFTTTYDVYSSKEEKLLFEAIKGGDLEEIKYTLEITDNGVTDATFLRKSCFGGSSGTVLHAAIGQPEVIELLLNEGANIDSFNNSGNTPLIVAANRGETETIRVLLKHGADINKRSDGDSTALSRGIHHINVVKLLLNGGADPNIADGFGRTPLLYASAYKGNIDIVNLLLANGADITAKAKKYDETLLHTAALHGHADIAQLYLEKGLDVNAGDNRGYTPLYWSISSDKSEFDKSNVKTPKKTNNSVTQLLLENGARTDDKSTKYFPWSGNTALVQKGLEKNTNVDVRDEFSRTPLHVATIQGNLELAKWLIEKGANVNAKASTLQLYNTPLRYALLADALVKKDVNIQLLKLLLLNGADPNAKYAGNNISLLHDISNTAAYRNNYKQSVEVAKVLLEFKADVNAIDSNSETPLHRVKLAEDNRFISLLVENGADVNAQDKYGRTALIGIAAAANTSPENAKLLIDLGADPNIETSEGKKAIDFLYARKSRREGLRNTTKPLVDSNDPKIQKIMEKKSKRDKEDWDNYERVIKILEPLTSKD
ncbi:MAG: ankyrin repeat domain-containing protein [Gammaproteobacteria bacterium]|nr:ankyrin repeat domain-containing protein [Gammaproteobacteria bacterium]